MNIFAFTSLINAIICFFLGLSIYYRNPEDRLNKLTLLFLSACSLWAFSEFGYRQANNYDEALFWLKISSIWSFVISFSLHYTLILTKRFFLLKNRLAIALIYGPAIFFFLFGFIFQFPVERPWGWTAGVSGELLFLYFTMPVWAMVVGLINFLLCWYEFHETKDDKLKKKLVFWQMAFVLPFVFGILSEGLLPAIGLVVPELTTSFLGFGALLGAYAIWRYDLFVITPEKAARSILSTMIDCLLILDSNGYIITVNQATLMCLGYDELDLINQPVKNIFITEFKCEQVFQYIHISSLDKCMENAEMKDFITAFQAKDGRTIPMSLSISVLLDNNKQLSGYVCVGRDITDRKRAEEQMKAQKEELSNFTHNMVHDLRNLLVNIEGYSNLLQIKYDREYCNKIESLTKKIDTILNRSLNLADAGKVIAEKKLVNLVKVVHEAAEVTLTDNNIIFQTTPLPIVQGDKHKLFQVFKNLFENARIHANATKVEIKAVESDNEYILLVTNNGNPISQEIKDQINEGRTKGIGLSITKKIVNAHGWQISLMDSLLTTFRIVIPKEKK